MSEPKRVPTQSLELAGTLANATKKEKKGEKGKQLAPSFRFELSLDDKNEKGYSEFIYSNLLKGAEKKRNKEYKNNDDIIANGLDPFDDDNDDKLREMAKRFEAKYGTTTGTTAGKNRKKHDDDVDLGAGYDESDSFIDNTDAYDEVVPEGVTTAHGGFYINSGPLEFSVKSADQNSLTHRINNNNDDDSSESSEDDVEDSNSPDSKRRDRDCRLLSSSDDDDAEEIASEPLPKKSKFDENGDKKLSYDGIVKKKKKLSSSDQQVLDSLSKTKIVDDKIERMEVDVTLEIQEETKKLNSDGPRVKDKKFDIKKFVKKPTTNGIEEKKNDLKKLVGKDSNIDDAIESVVNEGKIDDESSRDTVDSGKSRCVAGTSSECEDIDKADIPSLEQLPEDIRDIIIKLKKHAENTKEGKIKFFDTVVNSMLLSLEKKLRIMDSPSLRTQAYGYLAHFLNCSKVTLANRAKKLFLQDAENRVQEPVQRLKAIIDSTMPGAIESYNKECQRVADGKNFEGSPSDIDSSDGNEKTSEKSRIPRKQFPWTSEAKKLICDIATAWRQYFKIRKPRKESMESFVATFMKSKIVPLWPPGWMKVDILLKYANSDPVAKKKSKKPRDPSIRNNLSPTIMSNCSVRLEMTNISNLMALSTQENLKTSTNLIKGSTENSINFTTLSQSGKSSEMTIEKKPTSNKHKDKIRETSTLSSQHDNALAASSFAKISVVPTAQLMAQKPTKSHTDKFNPIDLTSSSLSITPVNDYPKSNRSTDELKKDVVSITPYTESSGSVTVLTDGSANRSDLYTMSNQSSGSKPLSLKQRILQESADVKIDKRVEEIDSYSTDQKEKKRERWMDDKYKSHEAKKRRKEYKIIEQSQQSITSKSEVSNVIQPPTLSKEEQEQRQIEETMAATNFLSQIINDDSPRLTTSDKRKDTTILVDESHGNIIQPSEQEKDVQMVMRSLKELQELQEMKFSPNNSPLQKAKSTHQYGSYPDDYHRLYHKKDEKFRVAKDEPQW